MDYAEGQFLHRCDPNTAYYFINSCSKTALINHQFSFLYTIRQLVLFYASANEVFTGDLFRFSGKACGVPRDGNTDKKEETELLWTNVVESQSAFLGPNLWDNKTIPYDNDLKVIILYIIV